MSEEELLKGDIDAYLQRQASKDTLGFLTCGSVDDGKSTLIGRLLYEAKMVFEDQLAALDTDSRKFGTPDGEIDFALLVDGLAAEREQGITIDVAYRYFTTEQRKFVVADVPGHEQYTRNMVTGASTASLAIIIIDASKGLLTQTRHHAFIASLLGIKDVVLAINKIDLVDYSQDVFDQIVSDFSSLNEQLAFATCQSIPLSGLKGDNVVVLSPNTRWYDGPTLMSYLETVRVNDVTDGPARLPVQFVIRPHAGFRGYAGRIAGGSIAPGDILKVLPSGQASKVKALYLGETELERASVGQSVTISLEKELDISRGDLMVCPNQPAEMADQFRSVIIWMNEANMLPGRQYLLKTEGRTVTATLGKPRHRINVNNYEKQPADNLAMNDVASCNISLNQMIAYDPYDQNRTTGSFILIDSETNETVGVGMIKYALRRSTNIKWQEFDVNKELRANAKHQKPCVLWFTGLSGAGKSTIANLIEKKLFQMGRHTMVLDGDNVRHGLNRDLGFTDADRVENIRRVSEVAKLFVEGGVITLVSFISPFTAERDMARQLFEDDEFIEVFVDAPLQEAERRDVKGLYKKARSGELKNFTGIDSPYEKPVNPDITLDTIKLTAEEAADKMIYWMKARELI